MMSFNTPAPGTPCSHTAECGTGQYCGPDFHCWNGGLNQPCFPGQDQCSPGLACGFAQRCVLAPGTPCLPGENQCPIGQYCNGTTCQWTTPSTGVDAPSAGDGGIPCSDPGNPNSAAQCPPGYICGANNTCVPYTAPGGPCAPGTNACPAGQYCGADSRCWTGQPGDPCLIGQGQCAPPNICGFNSRCQSPTPPGQRCSPGASNCPRGQYCGPDFHCWTGSAGDPCSPGATNCHPGLTCSWFHCRTRQQVEAGVGAPTSVGGADVNAPSSAFGVDAPSFGVNAPSFGVNVPSFGAPATLPSVPTAPLLVAPATAVAAATTERTILTIAGVVAALALAGALAWWLLRRHRDTAAAATTTVVA